METLLALVFLLTGLAVLVGLIRPSLVKIGTRRRALIWYGLPCFASLVVFAVITERAHVETVERSGAVVATAAVAPPAAAHPTGAATPDPVAKRAGLGDLLTTIDAQWTDWTRREFDQGGGAMMVRFDGVGRCEFHYTSGPPTSSSSMEIFGTPLRAASIRGTTRDCFGPAPNIERFFLEVQGWMPPDVQIQHAYDRERVIGGQLDKYQVYVFYSSTLASLPQIGSAYPYRSDPKVRVGTFLLKIHYFPDRNRVDIFDLVLGAPDDGWLRDDGYTTQLNPDGSKWFKPGRDG